MRTSLFLEDDARRSGADWPGAFGARGGGRRASRRAEHRIPQQARERPARALDGRVAQARRRRGLQGGVRPRRAARRAVQAGGAAVSNELVAAARALSRSASVRASSGSRFSEAQDSRSRSRSATPPPSAPKPRASGSRPFAADGAVGHGESCPRPYVTGETIDSARAFVERARRGAAPRSSTGVDCCGWIASHRRRDRRQSGGVVRGGAGAARSAWRKRAGIPVESLLSLPPLRGQTSATPRSSAMPAPATFHAIAERYRAGASPTSRSSCRGDPNAIARRCRCSRSGPGARCASGSTPTISGASAEEAIAGIPPRARRPLLRRRRADWHEPVRASWPSIARRSRMPDHPRRELRAIRAAVATWRRRHRSG